jgi:hypothetical protein
VRDRFVAHTEPDVVPFVLNNSSEPKWGEREIARAVTKFYFHRLDLVAEMADRTTWRAAVTRRLEIRVSDRESCDRCRAKWLPRFCFRPLRSTFTTTSQSHWRARAIALDDSSRLTRWSQTGCGETPRLLRSFTTVSRLGSETFLRLLLGTLFAKVASNMRRLRLATFFRWHFTCRGTS